MQQVICGDCLNVMKTIEDKSIDMILCDLPYGTTACKWDVVIPFGPLWVQYKRIVKDSAAIVLTASQPFTTMLIASNMKMFKYCWVWRKGRASNFVQAPNMPLKTTEDIVVFSSGAIGHKSQLHDRRMRYNPQGIQESSMVTKRNQNTSKLKYHRESQTNHTTGYEWKNQNYPSTLLEFKSAGKTTHPTQKPVALFEYLIKTYTNEGDLVLDNCAGSGTTGVACKNLNRQFILIEKDPVYYEIARKRIEATPERLI